MLLQQTGTPPAEAETWLNRALAVARSGRRVGPRGQAWLTGISAVAFLCLAVTLVARDVLPRLG